MSKKSDEELWAKLAAEADDRADAELPDAAVDDELRAAGADPDALSRYGAKVAAAAQAGAHARTAPAPRGNGAARPTHDMSSPFGGSGSRSDAGSAPFTRKKR